MRYLLTFFSILLIWGTLLFSQNFEDGFVFYLPADDTTSQRFLPEFPIIPVTQNDFVSVQNGHFAVNGERIRFWGTNATTEGAFPDQSVSPYVAGRLRKMGFNLIRFHHIDNGWSQSSLFEWGTDTRHFNPETLDRLEKYISELKRNGIYINMNLHVSRTVKQSDGVAIADSILNFGKGVFYFDPQLIALQKEYATQLLTHVNPYTGLALVNDPVMAMVEITNENSLYRMWRNGDIRWQGDAGNFSMYHVNMLDDLWMDFLHEKYGNNDELKSAWNSNTRPEGENDKIKDGGFENDAVTRNWTMELHETARADMSIDETDPYEGNRCARVDVTSVTGTNWHIQWKQTGITVFKDSLSTVTFAGKADKNRTVSVAVRRDNSPWTVYSSTNFQLTPEWQTYKFTFKATEDNAQHTRLAFSIGDELGSLWFDDIHLGASAVEGLGDDEHIDDFVRRIPYHECLNYSDNRVRDTSEFYKKLQDDYFVDMKNHLLDLGVKVAMTGTNWNVGPGDMAIQSELDFIDNHSYWDHPAFPNQPWSSTDWTINNTPMVRDQSGGTIQRLFAGVGSVNKPWTVSEYNHPFPNRYQSEGVLFITGYSGFHDIDAPMFFNYGGSQYDWDTDKVSGYFGIHRNTAMMSLMPSCALAFRNGLVAPSTQPVELSFSKDDILLLPKNDDLHWAGPTHYDKKIALQHAVRNATFNGPQNIDFEALPAAPINPYRTDTDEIIWDTDGLLQVVTAQFIGLTGFLEDYTYTSFGPLRLINATDFATLTWVSLTGDKLVDTEKSLFTLSTSIQNSDMIWDGEHTVHNNWGSDPTEMKPTAITLNVFMHADSLQLFTLDETGAEQGNPLTILPVSDNHFEIVLDQFNDETVWWGLEKFGEGTGVREKKSMPTTWSLGQNYPNPFNPVTVIDYSVPKPAHVNIKLYDTTGRCIKTLVNEYKQPGSFNFSLNASELPSGVYYYKFESAAFTDFKKMIVLQ